MISVTVALLPTDCQRSVLAELSARPEFELEICSPEPGLLKQSIHCRQPRVVLWESGLSTSEMLQEAGAINSKGQCKFIVMEMTARLSDLPKFVRANVLGVTTPDIGVQELCLGIRSVASGCVWVSSKLAWKSVSDRASMHLWDLQSQLQMALSAREQQVLRLICQGFDNAAIARLLELRIHTVKNHVHSILEKLGARDRTQLVSRVLYCVPA